MTEDEKEAARKVWSCCERVGCVVLASSLRVNRRCSLKSPQRGAGLEAAVL